MIGKEKLRPVQIEGNISYHSVQGHSSYVHASSSSSSSEYCYLASEDILNNFQIKF